MRPAGRQARPAGSLPQDLPSRLEPLTLHQHLAAASPHFRICSLRARNVLGYRLVAARCGRTTMTHMATVYRRPVGVMRQSLKPQLASWDRAGHPSQVKLARFLAHVGAITGPVLATVRGRVAAELIVGFSDGVCLIDGGHDLDNYLFPVAQRLG